MSALLKAGDRVAQSSVRPFGMPEDQSDSAAIPPPQMAGAVVAERSQHDDQRAELEAMIADLRGRLADAIADADEREDAAFERGRSEGEDLATGEADRRLELLAKGIEVLQQGHVERLGEYELLALQLARTALAGVFGDEAMGADLVSETLTHRLSEMKRDLVLGVRVSQRDFRSEEELSALTERLGGLAIAQDPALKAGDCLIDLRLGTIDLGLPGQWRRLSEFFDKLAQADKAA